MYFWAVSKASTNKNPYFGHMLLTGPLKLSSVVGGFEREQLGSQMFLHLFEAIIEAVGVNEFQSKTLPTSSPKRAISSFLPTHMAAINMC